MYSVISLSMLPTPMIPMIASSIPLKAQSILPTIPKISSSTTQFSTKLTTSPKQLWTMILQLLPLSMIPAGSTVQL